MAGHMPRQILQSSQVWGERVSFGSLVLMFTFPEESETVRPPPDELGRSEGRTTLHGV